MRCAIFISAIILASAINPEYSVQLWNDVKYTWPILGLIFMAFDIIELAKPGLA